MARFELGRIVATPGALALLGDTGADPTELLRRHHGGDWGDVDAHDCRANNAALKNGTRLLSSYTLPGGGSSIWIITEADRSSTCILRPAEY